MGPISNTARHVVTGAARQGLGGASRTLTTAIRSNPAGVRKFASNATQNFSKGLKAPMGTQCRNITEGIAKGDFTKAAVNAGMVGITAKLGGTTGTAKAATSNITSSMVAGMSMGMIPFGAGTSNKYEYFGQQEKTGANTSTDFQNAAQMAPEAPAKKPVTFKVYQGVNRQRARSASPGRRMMSTRNTHVEEQVVNKVSKPVMMPPYFNAVGGKKTTKVPKAAGLCMSFHNYHTLEKTQRTRSPSPPRRSMMTSRNHFVEQQAHKSNGKNPTLMPPYFNTIPEKKELKIPSTAGLAMNFHGYKPLI